MDNSIQSILTFVNTSNFDSDILTYTPVWFTKLTGLAGPGYRCEPKSGTWS